MCTCTPLRVRALRLVTHMTYQQVICQQIYRSGLRKHNDYIRAPLVNTQRPAGGPERIAANVADAVRDAIAEELGLDQFRSPTRRPRSCLDDVVDRTHPARDRCQGSRESTGFKRATRRPEREVVPAT